MYDANLGRFLSPDNNIQEPFNTQNFNRYGYALNNPLMYTDQDGEFFWFAVLIGALIGGVSAAAKKGANFGDILLGALIGGVAAGVGAGVGNLVAGGAFFGNAALSVTGFWAGAASGAAGGFAAGFVGSAATAWLNGASFGEGLWAGVKSGVIGGVIGGAVGGITGGIRANKMGLDFWHGNSLNNKTLSLIEMSGFNLDDAIDPTDANLIKARESWMPDAPMENVKNFTVENVPNDVQSSMDKFNAAARTRALYSKIKGVKIYTGRSSVYFNKNLAFTSPKKLFYAMAHEFQHVSQNALLKGLPFSNFTKNFTNLKEYHGYNYEHYLGSSNYGGFSPSDVRSLSTEFPKYFKSFHFSKFPWTKTVKFIPINFK